MRDRKGIDIDVKGGEQKIGVERGESIISIYFMSKQSIFQQKVKEKKKWYIIYNDDSYREQT